MSNPSQGNYYSDLPEITFYVQGGLKNILTWIRTKKNYLADNL